MVELEELLGLMARIRTIKPTFFTSSTITSLPVEARLTFIGLWTYVDDHGVGADDPRLVKAALWPLDDRVNAKTVEGHIASLQQANLVTRYTVDGKPYLHIRTWAEHQRVSHPQKRQFPEPPANPARAARESLAQSSGVTRESLGKPPEGLRPEVEGKGSGREEPSSSPSDSPPGGPQVVEEEDQAGQPNQESAVDVLIRAACELIATDELRSFQLRKPDQAPPTMSDREGPFIDAARGRAWQRLASKARGLLAKDPHLDAHQLAAALAPAPTANATNHEDLTGAAAKRIRDENEMRRAEDERLAEIERERRAQAEELLAKMSTDDRKALRAKVLANLGTATRETVIEAAMRSAVLDRQAS